MKIAVIGTRGFPSIQGGVETHCEELYTRIASKGIDVTVMGRKHYAPSSLPDNYKKVKLKWLPTIISKRLEAPVHTFLSVFFAKKEKVEIIHFHACGQGLFVPLAKILGFKVVFTHHGEDYLSAKWGKTAKKFLRLGEALAAKYADVMICVSTSLSCNIQRKYHVIPFYIPNGVHIPDNTVDTALLRKFNIRNHKLIVAVGRLVPGKGFETLINAYASSGLQGQYKLLIIGGSEHPSDYSRMIEKMAFDNNVILTGILPRADVISLMKASSLFVLPSLHEGLPIALLEAMSCNIDVLVSDIPSCRLTELENEDFFTAGDKDSLKIALLNKIQKNKDRTFNLSAYDWDSIADRTINIYQNL